MKTVNFDKGNHTKTYWNNQGKHQQLADAVQKLIPIEGPVTDAKLEKFRKAVNCYHDLYNNGLCNRAREFRAVFGFAAANVVMTQEIIDQTERMMDRFIIEAALEQGIGFTTNVAGVK